MSKNYVGLIRVSSREQAEEGNSLDVQKERLLEYARRSGGRVVEMFSLSETATRFHERKVFRELLTYVRSNAAKLAGVLFFKVDRATRNMVDWGELKRLKIEFGIRTEFISQPADDTPAGDFLLDILASAASFQTAQQSKDVKDGLARRVQLGLFVGKAPYGYQNVRIESRGLVEVHAEHGPKIPRIFDLYAFHGKTLDTLGDALAAEGIAYTSRLPRFTRSKLHEILRDRAYIGEVEHKGKWYPGTHRPLVNRATWDRVQILLGEKVYRSHEHVFGGEFVRCGHCGRPVTGETVVKKTTGKAYIYYRCSRYTSDGHPRVRLTEAVLDRQMSAILGQLRIGDEGIRNWFEKVLRARVKQGQQDAQHRREELARQSRTITGQRDQLLNMRLCGEIEAESFAEKDRELRDRMAAIKLQSEVCDRNQDEHTATASKVFELSQSLVGKWVAAGYAAKRQILEILCLNLKLENGNLVPTMRKPFNVLAEGLFSNQSRGDRI